jgi:hypothetical protein
MGVLSIMGLNPYSMQVFSYDCLPLLDNFAQIIHFKIVDWTIFINAKRQIDNNPFIYYGILTYLWKGMLEMWTIKWLKQCQIIKWYNKTGGTCTSLQVRPFDLDVSKKNVIKEKLFNNSWRLETIATPR